MRNEDVPNIHDIQNMTPEELEDANRYWSKQLIKRFALMFAAKLAIGLALRKASQSFQNKAPK